MTVYAGATILGRVTIGKGSTIGGNVWLTRSLPPHSLIMQQGPSPRVEEAGQEHKKPLTLRKAKP